VGQAFLERLPFFMFKPHRIIVLAIWGWVFVSAAHAQASGQSPATDSASSVQHGVDLARAGQCEKALPLLKSARIRGTEKELMRQAGLAGVRCATALDQSTAVQDFLLMLSREFPRDPEVLYVSIHAYSDLATRKSLELAQTAPQSPQAHELNAEALEQQGKWDQAEKEYQWILQKDPKAPGIHFRIGRLLLSKPNPPPENAAEAKKEFGQELAIDPNNAGAEYVLGELARQAQSWDEAAEHFSRAAKLDANFGDAYLGLGVSLASAKKFTEAISPLQAAVRLEPMNPATHYNLAMAYSRTGHKQEAEQEFAIHRKMTQGNTGGQNAPAAPQN
jgi:tetratricopeptide (TPR) repeat protein